MTDTRLLLCFAAFALLAACGDKPSRNDGRAASGEVLEGTISDEMLPVDRVRSEPPLEDPEAFAKAVSKGSGTGSAEGDEGAEDAEPAAEDTASAAPEAAPAAADE
jgi:hypothetical protein